MNCHHGSLRCLCPTLFATGETSLISSPHQSAHYSLPIYTMNNVNILIYELCLNDEIAYVEIIYYIIDYNLLNGHWHVHHEMHSICVNSWTKKSLVTSSFLSLTHRGPVTHTYVNEARSTLLFNVSLPGTKPFSELMLMYCYWAIKNKI